MKKVTKSMMRAVCLIIFTTTVIGFGLSSERTAAAFAVRETAPQTPEFVAGGKIATDDFDLVVPPDITYNVIQTGNYKITVRGAAGGDNSNDGPKGGSGANITATFALQTGDVLTRVTGIASSNGANAGGGGGSAVILTRGNVSSLLIVAGAGGGGGGIFSGGGGNSAQGSAGGGSSTTSGSGGGGGGFNAAGSNAGSTFGGSAGTLAGGGAGGGGGGGTNGSGGYGFGGGGGGSTGGGGGYGGGNATAGGIGGSGGSSFVASGAFNVTRTNGTNGGSTGQNGSVVIVEPFVIVTRTDDRNVICLTGDCSLREAVNSANATATDEAILFDPAVFANQQTITLEGNSLSINNNGTLTISGTGANQLTVSGNNMSRVFTINNGANVTINALTISGGNAGGGDGGGIFNNGTLTLKNLTVSSNTTIGGLGGGIYNNGTLTVTNSTVSHNTVANGNGGGIYNNGGTVITNCTLSENTASGIFFAGFGGGIYNSGSTLTITNSTLSGNTANNGGGGGGLGGGIYNDGTATLMNTIIAGNTASSSGSAPDFNGTLTSQGYNLIGNTNSTNITGTATGNITDTNARLAPLGNYGGVTQTQPLLSNSPAVNAGTAMNTPTTDQRGAGRVGNVDIGAFELNSSQNGGSFVASLPNGTQNVAYSSQIAPNNGTFTYTVTSGSLPNGVSLTTNFAPTAIVALTGTPLQSGTFNFAITASDGGNSNVTNYSFQVFGPTAASVSISGRVLTAGGRSIRNVHITLTDSNGSNKSAISNPFGYYRFADVSAGETYVISVRSKIYTFSQPTQVLNIYEDVAGINFIADSENSERVF